ncbi:discoidin domain-containing protein [Bacillus mobilis]|uniref:discoidin domain-containing protein n=1 Tax=Bacillus mobilis TaxID=2026190 RepID=UPI003CFC7024
MIGLARNGYTDTEVRQALHGARGSRSVSFRYELLDKDNNFKANLYNVVSVSIDYGMFNDIKRTASFDIRELAAVNIDYYSDRIRPYMVLDMPPSTTTELTRIRYIRDWANGNSVNGGNHWVEIEAYNSEGVNKALGKAVTSNVPNDPLNPASVVTDGNTQSNRWTQVYDGGRPCWIQVDLGEVMAIEKINVRHYFADGRTYKQTKTEVSMDGVNWTTVFDSAISGTYAETSQGKTHSLKGIIQPPRPKSAIEFPLGIFMLASPERNDAGEEITRSIEAYDLSLILQQDKVEDIYTVTAGTNYKTAIIAVLQSAGITDYYIEDTTKATTRDLQYEVGTDKMAIVNALLGNINYIPVIVDENGRFTSYPYIAPDSRTVDYVYDDSELSIIMKGVAEELDTFNTPNKWIIVRTNSEEEPLRSVYTNSNPESPTSTINRGRTIVDYRELEDIADQAALDAYTKRIAENASQVYGKVKFSSALMPMHGYSDAIQLKYRELGIDYKFMETAWSLQLEAGGTMSHEIRRVVKI